MLYLDLLTNVELDKIWLQRRTDEERFGVNFHLA